MVYPNPVFGSKINVRFLNQPKGKYVLKLINNLGQKLITKQVYISESDELVNVKRGKNIINGAYRLQVIKTNGSTISTSIVLE